MRAADLTDLSRVVEFRQTLEARPPRLARASLVTVAALVLGALAWARFTRTETVVTAPARVRPAGAAAAPLDAPSGAPAAAEVEGRVVEVLAVEGATVVEGEPLARLDAERAENEIARLAPVLEAGREELARLERLRVLLAEESASAVAGAEAAVAAARTELDRASKLRDAEVRVAEAALVRAEEEVGFAAKARAAEIRRIEAELESLARDEKRARELAAVGAVAPVEAEAASAKRRDAEERLSRARVGAADSVGEARERLERARVPADASPLDAALNSLDHACKEAAYRAEDLDVRIAARRGDVEAAARSLANLERDRRLSVVLAPRAGVVTEVFVRPGDVLRPGAPVAAVAPSGGVRIDAQVSASDVARIRPGMRARVRLDAWDFRRHGTVDGTVSWVSPDARVAGREGGGAAFYLVTIDVPSTEFGRDGARATMKIGMTGSADFVTGEEVLLDLAFRKLKDKTSPR
ncbi:MAG: HlyD family efflux transporter periplasmic adaptor subunit [Planctomycetes bacterium]|nr:HlyD family efflux transporter periplasmic adaptor subunit [Planctomycetota bacterium]